MIFIEIDQEIAIRFLLFSSIYTVTINKFWSLFDTAQNVLV
jgi:hypothetical protein